jgi:hypothetical protein
MHARSTAAKVGPTGAEVDFARTAAYSAVVEPLRGVAQIVDHYGAALGKNTEIDASIGATAKALGVEPAGSAGGVWYGIVVCTAAGQCSRHDHWLHGARHGKSGGR